MNHSHEVLIIIINLGKMECYTSLVCSFIIGSKIYFFVDIPKKYILSSPIHSFFDCSKISFFANTLYRQLLKIFLHWNTLSINDFKTFFLPDTLCDKSVFFDDTPCINHKIFFFYNKLYINHQMAFMYFTDFLKCSNLWIYNYHETVYEAPYTNLTIQKNYSTTYIPTLTSKPTIPTTKFGFRGVLTQISSIGELNFLPQNMQLP